MAGRPREFDRDKALANARDAFWARGYEGTSMADLVAALGIASARIYAAFGSKRDLFQEAVGLYRAGDGGVATRALGEAQTARQAIEKMLFEAIENCTRPGRPQGCMIISAATNCTAENDEVLDWLAERRMEQTERIIARLEQGVAEGELKPDTDTQMLGDYFATIMRGLSVQARDGVASARLLGFVPVAMQAVDAALAHKAAAAGKE